MAELLFEIGCEEMPARFVKPAIDQLKKLAEKHLGEAELDPSGIVANGTPRRLTLIVKSIKGQQDDKNDQVLGPPVKAAYDAEGNPTKAALGFSKSQGIDPADLEKFDTDKGERVGFMKAVPGRPAPEVLSQLLPEMAAALHFPKTMRWGSQSFRFARPLHWFAALLDGAVIPFELAGIASGNVTYGHRFMSPDAIEVSGASDYMKKLEDASVMVDRSTRQVLTKMEVETTAQQNKGKLVEDNALLEEVTDLVELPVACCGSFDPEFLEVPRPVIISAMRSHQRYFALEDKEGNLLPKFIAVNNTQPSDLALVARGHEKVLRARLADARFFLTEDTKLPLFDYLEDLREVTYHAKLGTSHEKVQRFAALAGFIAETLDPELKAKAVRAAELCKCDLVTDMVGEFPDLQGVVGAEYARRSGEDAEVAAAIEEHYMPAGAEAPLPEGMLGAMVGMADRVDSICGLFGIGETPSGAADPYGLRRAAIAVIRLVTEKGLSMSLAEVLDKALDGLMPWLDRDAEEVKAEIFKFFAARFQGLLAERGVPTDVAQAVLAAGLDDFKATEARALALAQVKDSPDFMPLAIGMKRCMNILRKEADHVPSEPPKEKFMTEAAEKELFQAFSGLAAEAQSRFEAGEYADFLQGLSALKGPIDKFFDDVLVMDKDDKVRANRLALLNQIAGMFRQIAEFTHLQLA